MSCREKARNAQRGQAQSKMNCRKRTQRSQKESIISSCLCVLCVPSWQKILWASHDSSLLAMRQGKSAVRPGATKSRIARRSRRLTQIGQTGLNMRAQRAQSRFRVGDLTAWRLGVEMSSCPCDQGIGDPFLSCRDKKYLFLL